MARQTLAGHICNVIM